MSQQAASAPSMSAAFVNVEGVSTRYLFAGKGAPLILLHGVGLSADCFIRNIETLADSFSVYAVDLLGHGFTGSVDFKGVAPQEAMARHIVSFARTLDLSGYSLAGSSFGALVAGLAYFRDTNNVSKLIMIGSGSAFHGAEDQKATLQASLANGLKAMQHPTLSSCRRRIENIVFDPSCVPAEMLALQLTSYALPDRIDAYRATIEGSIAAMDDPKARILPRLEHIACPTLVIVGANDIRADWKAHRDGARRLPNCEFHIYDRCGHLPFLEHSSRFDHEVRDFMNRMS